MTDGLRFLLPLIGGCFAVGVGALGLAALGQWMDKPEPKPEPPKPLSLPGPHGMESRLDYAHLGRVVEAKRMVEREG